MPEAGPGFGDNDAVAGVAGVVAELDGLVDAEAKDLLGQVANVLGAVVRDAGKAVAVDEDVGGGGDAIFAGEGAGVEDDAVGDAAGAGEVFTAAALDLVGVGTAQVDDEPDTGHKDDNAHGDAGEKARVAVVQLLGEALEKRLHSSSQG